MKKLAILLGTAALLSGCSVMHFKNGDVEAEGRPIERWHHNVAYSLYELSKPVDMKALCDDKQWSMVTTKETFITGLAGSADSFIYVDLWDPQMVEYYCGK
jgi:hypothetical protein